MALYDITHLKVLRHGVNNGYYYNSLVKIDDTHFILAYEDDGNGSFIKTFSIDGSYNITQLKSLEHDTANGSQNSLVKIDDTHCALAYSKYVGEVYKGFIKTFSIDGSYNITQIDSLEHDTVNGTSNSLVKIDDTHFMLAYAGVDGDGFIKTFSIDSSYNITQIDSLEHDTANGSQNSLVKIDDTHFILAYAGVSNRGYIKTFSIDGSYNITQLKSLEHDTSLGYYNSLVKIDDTHFILAYAGVSSYGYIKTFSIDGSYNITQIASLQHVGGFSQFSVYNSLVKIDDTHFMLAYAGNGNDGFIKTFSIDGSYNITQLKVLEHDTRLGEHNSLVKIDDTHYMLAYWGAAGDTVYATVKIFYVELPIQDEDNFFLLF